MTSPDPFWENVVTKVGHLKKDQHHRVLNITELARLLDQNGFEILISKKIHAFSGRHALRIIR